MCQDSTSLILQKPHPRWRSTDHVKAIYYRLQKWKNGDTLHERRTIQQCLLEKKQVDDEKFAKVLTSLVFRGKVRDAFRLLNKQANIAGVLSLDNQVQEKGCVRSVREILRENIQIVNWLTKMQF